MRTLNETLSIFQQFGVTAELVSAPPRLKISEYQQIPVTPGQIIVDASTLLAAGRTLPILIEKGLEQAIKVRNSAEIEGTLSLIQSMVIHDSVWVDALTFARSENSIEIASKFSPFIQGFIVNDEDVYKNVYRDVCLLYSKMKNSPNDITDVEVDLSRVEDIDRQYLHPNDVFMPPPDCKQSQVLIFEYNGGQDFLPLNNIPISLGRSDYGIHRTLFYLNLSAVLNHPYAPHPQRSVFLNNLFSDNSLSTNRAEYVVKHFDTEFLSGIDVNGTSIKAPPIAMAVLNQCHKIEDFLDTIVDFRFKASDFRNWCIELEEAYRLGRRGISKIRRMEEQLENALKCWKSDINEGVKYQIRDVEFPFLNKFIKVEGISNIKIKDPIIWSKYKPLIFLNSLYR